MLGVSLQGLVWINIVNLFFSVSLGLHQKSIKTVNAPMWGSQMMQAVISFGLRAGYQVEYKQFGAEIAGFNIGLCFALITW